ncbi:MAG: DUF3108 domain-containing protein [Candidatus Cloacimonetes bacterium]|nr:DUF3108 domain-containing protein [Candidatus Cloacimonadota bacterium]
MKKLMIWTVLAFSFALLWSYRTVYNVKSLGLSVARITIDHDKDTRIIRAEAKSLMSNWLFPSLDNVYVISYEGAFYPRVYTRQIKQSNAEDIVVVNYDRKTNTAIQTRRSNAESSTYPIKPDIRDYFSLFTYLCENQDAGGTYYVDGNSTLWQINAKYLGSEKIKINSGSYQTKHYKMRFKNLSGIKPPYVDMVTFNTLSESSVVDFWVSGDGIPIKAVVKKSLLSMTWEMVSHTP